jgi:putative membrane protein
MDPQQGTAPSSADEMSVELSARRTGMSFQRTRMSADRTLMSIIRTSLSLISFGFTLYQLFLKLDESQVLGRGGSGEMRLFSAILVLLGIIMLVLGIAFHLAFMRGLRRERSAMKRAGLVHGESRFPVSLTLIVAILLLLLGIFALASIALSARTA